MKLVYENVGHIITFEEGYVNELVIENKRLFSEMAESIVRQSDGEKGGFVLSIDDKPVEIGKNTDVTVQFAPFELNRKSLITKLCSDLEKKALLPESYGKTMEILGELEAHVHRLAEELPFEIECGRISIGPVIKALSPEIEEGDKSPLEKIFSYMELVRELDKDRLFLMINMRSYFSDDDMNVFVESVCLHDFKVLLMESSCLPKLKNTKRYVIDEDLCEF